MLEYPQEIIAGESFTVICCDGAPGDWCGVNLGAPIGFASTHLYLAGPAAGNVVGTLLNGSWSHAIDSATWPGGEYAFELWGTKTTGGKVLVARETFRVIASLQGASAGSDIRSQAQRNVDALETYIAGIGNPDADQSVARYRINNRELFNYHTSEILNLLEFWRKRVAKERRKARGLVGAGPNINSYI